ncbi:hypothetical protein [Rhodococcus pyridinivorans]|uniref:hypothetical protein n=1 Tax=Rhodococcus pyridinivorans TaxID=103816 RepID=UPI003AAE3887
MTSRRDDNAIRGLVFAIGLTLLVIFAVLIVIGTGVDPLVLIRIAIGVGTVTP